ncbi:acyl-CoA dehydrogenase family protein [Pseudomonas lopnurensis]|uniref:acyl-CoA dehydrogenase family protein n=1 Tax=Pseudomonas lopnurensis TaxID=1477517 RepID=UPI0028AB9B8C|nr:acyl-CoA dehydrogenase family protein [Pseudomonas lopnurensis]
MNFLLSPEQLEFQSTIQRFLDDRCPSTHLHEVFDRGEHDQALWREMSELGLAGIALPEDFGGAGMEMIDLALVAESLGSRSAPGPFLGHALAGLAIAWAGSEEQKQRWLPGLASGELLASVAFAEAGGWHPEHWTLAGERLDGSKLHVPFAAEASLLLVGLVDGGLAIVERAAQGLNIEAENGADRTRLLSRVNFADTPVERLAADAGVAARVRDAALVLLAADAFGGASRCVEMAVEYAKIREQFGQPIGQFQAVKHQLVNMAVEIEPARGLYWYAAHAFDHIPADAERYAALAKAHLSDRFLQVARDTVEVHGGIGYTWECDVQIYLKRAMFDFAFMGNPAAQRARISL